MAIETINNVSFYFGIRLGNYYILAKLFEEICLSWIQALYTCI
jgi:hypothetical protein